MEGIFEIDCVGICWPQSYDPKVFQREKNLMYEGFFRLYESRNAWIGKHMIGKPKYGEFLHDLKTHCFLDVSLGGSHESNTWIPNNWEERVERSVGALDFSKNN